MNKINSSAIQEFECNSQELISMAYRITEEYLCAHRGRLQVLDGKALAASALAFHEATKCFLAMIRAVNR